jgi:hypothetical protein
MPIYAGVGISTNKDYKLAVAEAVYQARINLKQKEISLAIVFTSSAYASPYLLKAINSLIGTNVPLLGTTTSTILTQDGIYNHAVAIVLISTKEAYFNTALIENALTNLQSSGEDLGKQLLFGMTDLKRHLCLFFADGLIIDNLPFLKGLQQRLGLSFPIIGATAASHNIRLNKTYQYFNQKVSNGSIVGLLWAGKVNFGLGIKHGWKPLGKPHRVSASDKYIIKEIEGKPAVSLYQDYFAKNIPELKRELKRISRLYPIGINISGEEEYLLRNILFIRDDGSLICQGDVPTDSQVRLMIGTKESTLAATEEAAKQAKQAQALKTLPTQEQISIIFVFNSISRLYLLGRHIIDELAIIKSHFPGKPIIGLCTYGEQAPLKAMDFTGKAYCHSQTITVVTMG